MATLGLIWGIQRQIAANRAGAIAVVVAAIGNGHFASDVFVNNLHSDYK